MALNSRPSTTGNNQCISNSGLVQMLGPHQFMRSIYFCTNPGLHLVMSISATNNCGFQADVAANNSLSVSYNLPHTQGSSLSVWLIGVSIICRPLLCAKRPHILRDVTVFIDNEAAECHNIALITGSAECRKYISFLVIRNLDCNSQLRPRAWMSPR